MNSVLIILLVIVYIAGMGMTWVAMDIAGTDIVPGAKVGTCLIWPLPAIIGVVLILSGQDLNIAFFG